MGLKKFPTERMDRTRLRAGARAEGRLRAVMIMAQVSVMTVLSQGFSMHLSHAGTNLNTAAHAPPLERLLQLVLDGAEAAARG